MASKVKEIFESWEKWQVAVAIGAPIALGIAGLWYYKRSQNQGVDGLEINTGVHVETAQPQMKQLLAQAQDAKNKGNKNFKAGKYDSAIENYTEAIGICPDQYKSDLATFYQNRAAAHDHLKNYREIVADCDMAISLNARYTKAFLRRAKAHEKLGQLMESLMDVTAVCILESFKNPNNLQMADRVLKDLGKSEANVAFQERVPNNPSNHFIRNYYNGFVNDPVLKWTPSPASIDALMRDDDKTATDSSTMEDTDVREGSKITEDQRITDDLKIKDDVNFTEDLKITEESIINGNSSTLDNTQSPVENSGDLLGTLTEDTLKKYDKDRAYTLRPFHKARENLLRGEYDDIINLCNEELESADSCDEAPALLLRATFYLLRGELAPAKVDLNRIIENEAVDKKIRVNALIKRGSLLMQEERQTDSLADFASAVRIDPENCDVYHHRGQQNLVLDRVQDAQSDFERSIQLNPAHAISHVQKCYAGYREAMQQQNPIQLQVAVKNFGDIIKRFPLCPDGHLLYAQALADEMRYDEADAQFGEALGLDPHNSQTIVHRALLCLQWKQDIEAVCAMIEEAIRVDPLSEFAYETLGTLKVQKGDLTTALKLFDQAAGLCRSESEMAHVYSLKNAAIAQVRVARNFQIVLPSMM